MTFFWALPSPLIGANDIAKNYVGMPKKYQNIINCNISNLHGQIFKTNSSFHVK